MTHRSLVTQMGNPIPHWHRDQVSGEFTATEKANLQASTLASYPGITPVDYIHLDHTTEQLLPSRRYNCWGFTFNPRQCWVGMAGSDIQLILNDNGTAVTPPNLRIGDVVVYRDNSGVITHTGRIWSLDATGNPALVQSKWGSLGEYFHAPLTVPASYGTDVTYYRVVPISGKGDAWAKDFPGDDRNVSPPGVALWMSPDLWCNNFGGTAHHNPIRHQPNELWVRVHNEDTLPITDAQVHVYWSDPTGGMPHYQWHSIGTVSVSVPAGPATDVVAGPVSWTPGVAEPQHCCLFAVVDTGDDPYAASTLDPIVWPFDVRRDNNIVWKNMWLVAMPAPSPSPRPMMPVVLEFSAENPQAQAGTLKLRLDLQPVDKEEVFAMGFDHQALKMAERMESMALPKELAIFEELMPARIRRAMPMVAVLPDKDLWRRARPRRLSTRGLTLTSRKVRAGSRARVRFLVQPDKRMRPGSLWRLDVEQQIDGHITGGGTFVLMFQEDRERRGDA